MQWYSRAVRFGDAVLSRDWASTYQRYHPGVTTMWLSGVGLKAYAARHDLTSDQLLGFEPTKPGVLDGAVTAGVVPLAVAISLCIVLAAYLTTRIAGRVTGVVAGCLLALDPFYIGYSKVLHVDALTGSLMIVSTLGLLLYIAEKQRSALILSAIFGGAAFLSKSTAFFLIPFTTLALGVSNTPLGNMRSSKTWLQWFMRTATNLLVWCVVAAIVFVVLWPTMWVEPLAALQKIGERIFFHVGTPHYNPVFFNGKVTMSDPGWMFYPATIAFKTTFLTLPMLFLALVSSLFCSRAARTSRFVLACITYAFFFTLQMSLSARKELAYLMPVLPALDLVAAVGFVRLADALGDLGFRDRSRFVKYTFITIVLGAQGIAVLSHHPYYGTHHNRILGGSRVAKSILPLQDQAEGLDIAADFLSDQPSAQRARVAVHQRGAAFFQRYFVGQATSFKDPPLNYRVYFVNQVMRDLGIESWGEYWEQDSQSEPLWSVDFDGVTYVWIYGTPPTELAAGGPTLEAGFRLGEHISLQNGRINTDIARPGDELTVALWWNSDGMVKGNYKVFCHILSEDGDIVAQDDDIPVNGVRPTPGWRTDETIEDSCRIVLGTEVEAGDYRLGVGMYDPKTMIRLPAYDSEGGRLSDDTLLIGKITVVTATESGN
jgi:hypothetical protein